MKLYQDILRKHRFSGRELKILHGRIARLTGSLRESLAVHRMDAEVMLGGSAAKGTMLKGDFDCDVFVRFGPRHADEDLSEMLGKALAKFNATRLHGSRDYFQLEHEGINYEIIPVLNVSSWSQAKNVTDMSPLHVSWIKRRLEGNPALADEILLAKVFCKSIGAYGAESYISGFSGHVIDVLIAYYGSFDSLLRNAVSWNRYKVIDIEDHNTHNELNESKLSPLIVIDPLQRDRNAAAALSLDKFELFKRKAAEFIKHRGKEFFMIRKLSLAALRKKLDADFKGRPKVILTAEPVSGTQDVAGTKLLKAFVYIQKQLLLHDFDVIDSGWQWDRKDEGIFWYILMSSTIARDRQHLGPPLRNRKDVRAFKAKHSRTFEKGSRIYAIVRRKHTQASELVNELISQEYVKQRAKGMKIEMD